MKSTVENLSPVRVRLAVQVPFDELKPSLDAAYKKIGASVRIPGFRPGKAPARVIDQRVGRGAVLEEAVNSSLPGLYSAAVREHSLQPISQPDLDISDLTDGESLSFTAEVDVRPQITLPDLAGLAVSVDDADVSDADVEEQLQALRARFGSLTGVERPVQTGDYVSLDLDASVGGEPVEAGTTKGMSYQVGSGDLIDGLDDAVLGKSAGEAATFTATLQQGERAGAQADITATVNSVKEQELPALDDEFAQLASEFDTVEELRGDLRTRLARAKEFEQGAQARDRLLEKLTELVEFPLPESAVQEAVDFREHEVVHSLGHDDAAFERYLTLMGTSHDQFSADLRDGAETSVRAQFILDAVADQNGVEVGDAELTEYLIRQAGRYDMPPQEFANQVVQGGNLPALMSDVRRSKALAGLLETAEVSDASGNKVDLAALGSGALAEIADSDSADDDEVGDLGTTGTDGSAGTGSAAAADDSAAADDAVEGVEDGSDGTRSEQD